MHEDKHEICRRLFHTLKATANCYDLLSLVYNDKEEIVYATFVGGYIRRINVAADSGTAFIRDVMRYLGV